MTETNQADRISCKNCKAKLNVSDVLPFSQINCPRCDALLRVPQRFDNFLLTELLQSTDTFKIYRAFDPSLNRDICIKVLNRKYSQQKDFAAQVMQHAGKLALLSHPSLVPVYSCGEFEGKVYLVLHFMNAGSLKEYIKLANNKISLSKLLKILSTICQAVELAANKGILANNLSITSILVNHEGVIKISNLGLTDLFLDNRLLPFSFLYNEQNIAPEVLIDHRFTAQSLSYTLGTIFYETCTAEAYDSQIPVNALRPDLPKELNVIIQSLCHQEPAKRNTNLGDIREELESLKEAPLTTTPSNPYSKVLLFASVPFFLIFALCFLAIIFPHSHVSTIIKNLKNNKPTQKVTSTKAPVIKVKTSHPLKPSPLPATNKTKPSSSNYSFELIKPELNKYLQSLPSQEAFIEANHLNQIADIKKQIISAINLFQLEVAFPEGETLLFTKADDSTLDGQTVLRWKDLEPQQILLIAKLTYKKTIFNNPSFSSRQKARAYLRLASWALFHEIPESAELCQKALKLDPSLQNYINTFYKD